MKQENNVVPFAFRASMMGAIASLALALAAPVSAQLYSDGYLFLQAVKDRDGNEATEMLETPGSTVINARDVSTGETGLHYVVQRRDLVWTRWLLQEGANPNIADRNGVTPLITAIQLNFIDGVEALLEGGAQVDIANRTGETPLIFAVHARNIDLIEVLLEAGADPDRSDNAGRSARDYARERGPNDRTLAVIEEHERPESERAASRIYGPSF